MHYARHWELHPALPYVAEWTTTARLSQQKARWRQLATNAIEPNPFYEPEFLLASAEHIEKADIRCIAVYRDGAHDAEMIGLFPLRRAQLTAGLPLPALELYRNAFSPLTAPLIAGPDAAGVWRCFFEAIARAADTPRMVLSRFMPTRRGAYAALEAAASASGRAIAVVEQHCRAAVENVSDFDSYTALYGTKRNKDIRRRERRLRELGSVEMRTVRDANGKRAALADFLRIEAAGWKGREGTAMACKPETQALAEAIFLSDAAEFDVLTLDGKTITVNANIVRNGVVYMFKTAYDEEYHQCSPGVTLDLHDIRNLVTHPERYSRIDSLAIAGHPIEARWCQREEIASVVIHTAEKADPSRATSFASLLRGANRLKGWVKEQIAARKG